MSNTRPSTLRDNATGQAIIHDEEVSRMTAPAGTLVDSADTENADEGEDHLLIMSYRTNIAANTKRLRETHGLRQKDLAKLMGTAQGHIASLEKARISIGLHTLARLAFALKVEASALLLPFNDGGDSTPTIPDNESPGGSSASVTIDPVDVTQTPRSGPTTAPELLIGHLAVGVSLTTVKEIVAATHKRLEALERRHGSVPMTREMLTSVLVTLLNASQNLDSDVTERS